MPTAAASPIAAGLGATMASSSEGLPPSTGPNTGPSPTEAMPSSVIHLDFFSGIGSATLALLRLGIKVRHVLSWEIDEAAILVARKASKKITKSQREILLDDDPAAAARAVEQVPGGAADLLVITAAPPCPDFSRVRPDAPGRHGQSGNLFVDFTKFMTALLNLLPGRRACLLVENVRTIL